MRNAVFVALLLLLAACAPPPITVTATYNPDEAAFSRQTGSRTVSGQAFLRQAGGNVVTCAGEEVFLTPSTNYARERIAALYGNLSSGYNPITGGRRVTTQDQFYTQYRSDSRKTNCDAQGNFLFRDVPPGDYFLLTTVRWIVPRNEYITNQEGGGLMKAVSVRGTDVTNLILTR